MSDINVSATASVATAAAGSAPPANPTNASARLEGGLAVFENDSYRITADDDNTVTIKNKKTGEEYKAWGDPHMNIDGQHTFDFWGTTTFRLEDGTKVTIETTPWANDPNATLSSRVTITNGDFGVRFAGVDSNTKGDLRLEDAQGYGRVLDAVVSDGNVLHENPAGKGFVAIDGAGNVRAVDQNYINGTDLKKIGALQDRYKEAFKQLADLFAIAFQGTFLGSLKPAEPDAGVSRPRPTPFPPPPRIDDRLWAGGTPPWIFDESANRTFLPADARIQSQFSLVLARAA